MRQMWRRIQSVKGQGLVEYGLILMLIAVVLISALTAFGENRGNMFEEVANSIEGAG